MQGEHVYTANTAILDLDGASWLACKIYNQKVKTVVPKHSLIVLVKGTLMNLCVDLAAGRL